MFNTPLSSSRQSVVRSIDVMDRGRHCSRSFIHRVPHSFKFRAPAVVPLNGSPAHTPKVYRLTEVEQRAKMGSESLERNNDSGRGRSHVAMQPGSTVGNDQYLMRNPNLRHRTVLVRNGAVLALTSLSAYNL
jgi:hypothetical protein